MSFLTTLASAFKGGGVGRVPLARGFTSPWALALDRSVGAPPFDYGARILSSEYAQRARWQGEQLTWRIAELNPSLKPGSLVKAPGHAGAWLIGHWEWSDEGIELALDRVPAMAGIAVEGHAGELYPPVDLQPLPSLLRAFELPWDGYGDSSSPSMFAAMSAEAPSWSGAALFVEQGGALLPLDLSSKVRSVVGSLATELPSSASVYLDRAATFEVDLVASDLGFASITVDRLAAGANRILIGEEVLQFLFAEPISPTRWQLSALLRGRGGTEHFALAGHAIGASVVLLDDTLVPLDPAQVVSNPMTQVAAIGFGDEEPVYAQLEGGGSTRLPLSPVHPRVTVDAAGNWHLGWTRRARGQWRWEDYVDTSLIEEQETYLIGLGQTSQPVITWQASASSLSIDAATISSLLAANGPQPLWVRQIGTFGQSPATLIAQLS